MDYSQEEPNFPKLETPVIRRLSVGRPPALGSKRTGTAIKPRWGTCAQLWPSPGYFDNPEHRVPLDGVTSADEAILDLVGLKPGDEGLATNSLAVSQMLTSASEV